MHKPKEHQVAETVHTLNHSDRAYRLIVVREPREQLDLFEEPYIYRAIISNIPDHSGRAIFRWHRKKGDGENVIKEGKGGFAMEKLPSGSLLANAAYFQIALLAYNLVQAWKLLPLPPNWHHYTIKTLRFRLLNVAGLVVHHARQLVLKLPRGQPFFDIFHQSRMRTLGLGAE
jgi:hypothetical protein